MKRRTWSLVVGLAAVVGCGSGTDKRPDADANGGGSAGTADAGAGGVLATDGGVAGDGTPPGQAAGANSQAGGAGSEDTGMAGADNAGTAGSGDETAAPSCSVPATVLGSCEKKDSNGKLKACTVYWGSAFTPDALMAGCPMIVMGENVCPAAAAVGACETSDGPTALANYYYEAAAGTPANQAQCNANVGHVWCTPR